MHTRLPLPHNPAYVPVDGIIGDAIYLVNRYMWGIDGVPNKEKERMLSQIDGLIEEAKRSGEQYPVYLGV